MTKTSDDKKYTINIGKSTVSDTVSVVPSVTYTAGSTVGGINTVGIDADDITFSGCSTGIATPQYTYTFDSTVDTFSINFDDLESRPEVWPSQHTIEEMIKEYPALALQYHRFIELYNLCKDDYYSGKQNDELF
jgi:hypothetical protein